MLRALVGRLFEGHSIEILLDHLIEALRVAISLKAKSFRSLVLSINEVGIELMGMLLDFH